MGFIGTGTTTYGTTAYLTQKGREYISTGNQINAQVLYFALGDSDANYNIINELAIGFVPDLTGNNLDCYSTIANNIDIKYKITFE